ncbi:hypothetical protein L0F63_004447 [Massospora cicadina]|nr:hypothetical protein L0F63_004447 [Massospora cicadina]
MRSAHRDRLVIKLPSPVSEIASTMHLLKELFKGITILALQKDQSWDALPLCRRSQNLTLNIPAHRWVFGDDSPSGLHLDPDFILDEAQPFDEFSVQENEKIICTEKEISLEELRASDERYVYSDVALKRRIDDLNASVDKHVAFIRKLAR